MPEPRNVKVTLKVIVDDVDHCSATCQFLGDFVNAQGSVINFRCDLFKDIVTMNLNDASNDRLKRLVACINADQQETSE
jgi:hypothetical protein